MQDYLDVCINTVSTVCTLIGLSEYYGHALHCTTFAKHRALTIAPSSDWFYMSLLLSNRWQADYL